MFHFIPLALSPIRNTFLILAAQNRFCFLVRQFIPSICSVRENVNIRRAYM